MSDIAEIVGYSFGAVVSIAALGALTWLLFKLYEYLMWKFCEMRNLTKHVAHSIEREFYAKLDGEDYWDE